MPVSDPTSDVSPLSAGQRKAAAALLRSLTPAAAELGEMFARAGHQHIGLHRKGEAGTELEKAGCARDNASCTL